MSKISIKTDFADGEKLFAQQLNNNFLVIQAGINANEENLQQVIDQAVIELDRELEEITANRGWDWNGGDRVTFFKGTTSQVNTQEIKNGQMLYNTETGETALDDSGTRIVTGSGNVVAISETAPTNPATKEWIKPSKMANYAASYVVNSVTGDEIDKSPSVRAIKNYVDGTILYSGDPTVDDVSLLEAPVGKYKRLKISYIYNSLYTKMVEINLEDKQNFTFNDSYILNNALITIFGGFQISDDTISKVSAQCGYIENSTMHKDGINYFAISEVIGYM